MSLGISLATIVGSTIRFTKSREKEEYINQNIFNVDEDNGEFDYEEAAFSGGASAQSGEKPSPRGYEQRHPDDAKLWAMVDDPEASDGERQNAYAMILKRQAKRNGGGGGGRGVARRN